MHTLGPVVLALQVQGSATAPPAGGDIAQILAQTGPLNIAVFLILAAFSVASWAIVVSKTLSFRKVQRQSLTFLDVFRRSQKFSDVQAVCPTLPDSPLVGVFQAGYQEVNQQVRGTGTGTQPGTAAARPTVRSLESLSRALVRAATGEVTRLERRTTFLATTATVTPFIGLFGTVWGIMDAFERIGQMGSANLAVVAPSISEALITTAMGLAAAIPAAFFFNMFSSRIKVLSAMMDDFALEFLNIVERNFT